MSTANRNRRRLRRLMNRVGREAGKAFLKWVDAEIEHRERFMQHIIDRSKQQQFSGGTFIQESIHYSDDDWNSH